MPNELAPPHRLIRRLPQLALFAALAAQALPHAGAAQEAAAADLAREELASAAREIMTAAGFATLVTLDATGAPRARVMDPLVPTDDLVVWMATNPQSRKVGEITADPRVALTYFDPAGLGYVTLSGRARLVDDAEEKARRWKTEWEPHYPDRGESLLLIEVRPSRLEVISVPRGLTGDPETWTPHQFEFPRDGRHHGHKGHEPGREADAARSVSPYSKLAPREIKALAPERIAGLEAGEGLGYVMAAELNRYPGPKHALELEQELALSPDQVESLRRIFDEMHASAVEAGRELIEAERSLDRLFAETTADPASLESAVRAAAAAEGRVRLAHLRAHLQTAAVLDRHQTHLYYAERGYEHGAPGHSRLHGDARHPGHPGHPGH